MPWPWNPGSTATGPTCQCSSTVSLVAHAPRRPPPVRITSPGVGVENFGRGRTEKEPMHPPGGDIRPRRSAFSAEGPHLGTGGL